jgi:branched-chain amino acid transport system permease protein
MNKNTFFSFSRLFYGITIILFLLPIFIKDPYFLHIIIMTMLNMILALSLNLLMITGQVSIAHAAFMGIGAYSSTLLVMRAGFSFWLALPLSGVFASLISVLIGSFTLKMKGIYFAMATFAFGEIIRMVFIGWVELFGGANGITNIPPPEPISIPGLGIIEFYSKSSYFYLVALVLLATIFIMVRLERSKIGRILKVIQERDLLAECIGLDIMKFKIFSFALSSFLAGVAGGLYAHLFRYIGPQSFTFWESVQFIVFVVVGGVGTVLGPICGAAFLTVLPEALRFTVEYQTLIYGVVLVLVLLFMPEGILGMMRRIIPKL